MQRITTKTKEENGNIALIAGRLITKETSVKSKLSVLGVIEQGILQKIAHQIYKRMVKSKQYIPSAPTELHTDASKDGLGGILFQIFDGKLQPIYYWSRKNTPEESRLHSFYLEIKAAYYAVQKFRHYLLGREFKLVTDCQAFKSTTTKKELPPAVTRWILYLKDYKYVIEHRKGTSMH